MNNNTMSMSNSKEAIQLLNASESDDSASDIQFSLAPPPTVQVRRKVRTKRKHHRKDQQSSESSSTPSCTLWNITKIALITFCAGGTLILGWLVILLHSEVQQLTNKLASFPTSVDDETILGLKRSIKELSQNQSFAFIAIQNCSKTFDVFQTKIVEISSDIGEIKSSLKDAPQMMNIGKELESLKTSLANYEAALADLKHNLNEPKESTTSVPSWLDSFNTTIQNQINFIMEDLHHHHGMITELQNVTGKLSTSANASTSSAFAQRVDAVQLMLTGLEEEQRNTTATLSSLKQVVQRMNDFMEKNGH